MANILKPRSRYRNYLSLSVLVMLAVAGSFRFLQNPAAGMIAGSVFLASTVLVLVIEFRFPKYYRRPTFWGAAGFLVLSVLPILALRLLGWEKPFDQLALFGISGPQLHSMSNILYFVMVGCFFMDSVIENRKRLLEIKTEGQS